LQANGNDDLQYWKNFVERFFSRNGVFRHSLLIKEGDGKEERLYELQCAVLDRYFLTHFTKGIKSMQLVLEKGLIDRQLPGDFHFIECQKANLVYWFESGSHVSYPDLPHALDDAPANSMGQLIASGLLRAQMDSEHKFELFEFLTTSHEEYISRDVVITSARPVHNWIKEWRQMNQQDGTHSPEMSNKKKPKPYRCPNNPPPDFDLPQPSVKHGMGVIDSVYEFLEVRFRWHYS
jgi:hypothetical protein